MIIPFFNSLKSLWSRVNDQVMRGAGRRPVPALASPEAVGAYLMTHGRYTGDLAGGALDNWTHPERFQCAMETGDWRLPIDCDDFSAWAYVALLKVPGCEPQIMTLLDAGVVGSHVVCVYRQGEHFGVIDTNGHRSLPSRDATTLCQTFTALYASRGYRYVSATPTPFPF